MLSLASCRCLFNHEPVSGILASKDLAAGVPKTHWDHASFSADSSGHPAMMRAASNLSSSGQWAPKIVTVALKMEIVLLDDQNMRVRRFMDRFKFGPSQGQSLLVVCLASQA